MKALIILLSFSLYSCLEQTSPSKPKAVRADRYEKPVVNKNICEGESIPTQKNTLLVSGDINGEKVSLKCSGTELKYDYYYDHVGLRGSYEIRCKKSDYYFSFNIRNAQQGQLIVPNFPFGDPPSTLTLLLTKGKNKLSQNDVKRVPEHNLMTQLYVTKLELNKTRNSKGDGTDRVEGCSKAKFAKHYGDLVQGNLSVLFNLDIFAPRRNYDGSPL